MQLPGVKREKSASASGPGPEPGISSSWYLSIIRSGQRRTRDLQRDLADHRTNYMQMLTSSVEYTMLITRISHMGNSPFDSLRW